MARMGHASMARAGEARMASLALMPDHRGEIHTTENAMRKRTRLLALLITAAAVGTITAGVQLANGQDASAQATYRDIEQTLGSVPGFFKQFPEAGIAGAWGGVQIGPAQSEDQARREDQGADRPCRIGPGPMPILRLFPHGCRQGERCDR